MNATADFSQAARQRFLAREKKPLLVGDWTRALFLHYEVPAEWLQPHIPFDLDLWEGRAYVSAVAFSMEHLRPGFGGAPARWLFWPIARHDFFNVRTYVRDGGGSPSIFFMSEWLNNRWCVLSGPVAYGLPYHFARIHYNHRAEAGRLAGKVGAAFAYTSELSTRAEYQVCVRGSLDEFLIERYRAFTRRGGCSRYFDIWHEPWRQIPIDASISDDRLLRRNFPWFAQARLAGANYSPGARDVWMGAPRKLRSLCCLADSVC